MTEIFSSVILAIILCHCFGFDNPGYEDKELEEMFGKRDDAKDYTGSENQIGGPNNGWFKFHGSSPQKH